MSSVLFHKWRATDPQLLQRRERPEIVDVGPVCNLGHVDVERHQAGQTAAAVAGDGGHVGYGALGEGEASQTGALGPQVALNVGERVDLVAGQEEGLEVGVAELSLWILQYKNILQVMH